MFPTNARPCELERGDLRRVPQDTNHPVIGFHVCCPRCGFVTIALDGYGGLEIAESEDQRLVTFSTPVRCAFCGVLIHLREGAATLEEDDRVRNVRYR